MKIEIAYALPNKQFIEVLQVSEPCTVEQALGQMVEIKKQFPDLQIDEKQIGVFSKHVPLSYQLHANDRIEIYRPLLIDPKEARRKRAENKKS